MNQRSMHGPRRIDTNWPQTRVMRRRDDGNPYRRRRPRFTWRAMLDAVCWAIAVVAIGGVAVVAATYTVRQLDAMWEQGARP